MLRRAWQLGVAARGGAASTSAVSPSSAAHAATPRARLAPWSAAPLSSRADGPDEEQARRRALRRAARRELRAWRGADVTPRELRELKDGGGSKRRWARDWASAVFADDVGDGASYEAFVAEALRHGDGRRGPGSGPASDTGADTRRARREKSVRRAGGSGAPKGGGTRGVKYKHRRGGAGSSRRRGTSRRRRGARDDDFADDPVEWHEEHACDEADAFWRAFLRAARGTSRVGARKSANDRGDRGTDRREGFERSFRFEDFARARARASETIRGGDDDDRSRDDFVTCPDRSALGIAPGAALNKTLLKSSLRAAAMKWHPDRHAGAAAKRDAEAAFKKCYDAYDALVERTSV